MAKVKTGPKVKRKGGGVAAKAKKVDALAAQLSGANAVIVTDYRGLRVGELQALRRRLRPKGVEYHVVKNSLFGRAATASDRAGIRSLLTGPTAVALAGVGAPAGRGPSDEVELARGLVEETRTLKALKILGAFVGGKVISADDVQTLARLPGLPVLQATLVGTLQAPLQNVVGIMTAAHSNLIRVLQARSA